MDDFEEDDAQEWDLHYKTKAKTDASSSEWQVVGGAKTKTPAQLAQLFRPQAPQTSFNLRAHQGNADRTAPLPVQGQQRQRIGTAGAPVRNDRPLRPLPKLNSDTDNSAQKAWRNREPPKSSLRIPDELALQDSSYQTIANQNGAFIFTEHPRGIDGFRSFDIWGDDVAVSSAIQSINSWIAEWRSSCTPTKSARTSKFAKVASLNDQQRTRAEKAWRREVKKQRFRQNPPPGMSFGAIGSFHWPVAEYRPDEILGKSFEALDPIRMEHSCYVIFRPEQSVFQVFGKQQDVQEGLMRIRKTCFQVAARQIAPIRLYLLHSPDSTHLPSHVYFERYEFPGLIPQNYSVDIKFGNSPRGSGADHDTDDDSTERRSGLSEERIRTTLLRTLPKLHYYRGSVQLRIRLGQFLATQFKRAQGISYTLGEYERMIQESQFVGHVTQEIGDKQVERAALATLRNADCLLQPSHAMIQTLADVKPVYSAIFTFAEEAGDLRLTISWYQTEDEGSAGVAFDVISKKWTRLERDANTTHPIVDISLQDLDTGFAWQFDIRTAQAVDESRLPTKLVSFSENVQINPTEALKENSDKLFVTYRPYMAGHLRSIEQRISYKYYFTGSSYSLELTRFQTRELQPRASLFSQPKEPVVYEPRWSLDVYRPEWDVDFAQNERLDIGMRAEWSHDIESWFPQDALADEDENGGAGFAELMEKLRRVGKLVREAKEEDLMGGMTVA